MKKIFFAAIALIALVSCAKEETLRVNRQEIAFGEAFVDNATRATDNTYGNITGFTVYGTVTGTTNTPVALYGGDGATVTRGDKTYNAAWDCSETEYWVPGAAYQFAAVVDAAANVVNGLPTTLTTVADTGMNFKDMLYAEQTVSSATANQGVVAFTFSHLLSKAQFTVTSNASGDYYHEIAGIKVANFASGTYTIATQAWEGTTAKDIEFGTITNVTSTSVGENAATNATQMLLVPNANTFDVTFTVNLYKGNTKIGVENKTIAVEADLVKGNAYNFTINCEIGAPIKFTVTNDPSWSDQPDQPLEK